MGLGAMSNDRRNLVVPLPDIHGNVSITPVNFLLDQILTGKPLGPGLTLEIGVSHRHNVIHGLHPDQWR